MKLEQAAKFLAEKDHEQRGKAPPVKGGNTISTKQASEILGVSPGRVRQMTGAGGEKKHLDKQDGSTERGSRDTELDLAQVQQLKKNKPKKGRPDEGKGTGKKGKDKKDDDKD